MLSVASLFQGTATGGARRARRGAGAREEERRRLHAAMQELPETARLALALRYFESARPRHIAAVLGMPEERVETILSEAVQRVSEILSRPDGEAPTTAGPRPRVRREPTGKVARA